MKAHTAYCCHSRNTHKKKQINKKTQNFDPWCNIICSQIFHRWFVYNSALRPSKPSRQLELSHAAEKAESVAAAPAVPAPVGVSCWRLSVFGPAAEDLVRAVVAAATGHARGGLVDFKPGRDSKERPSHYSHHYRCFFLRKHIEMILRCKQNTTRRTAICEPFRFCFRNAASADIFNLTLVIKHGGDMYCTVKLSIALWISCTIVSQH